MANNVLEINDSNFDEEVLKSNLPVLVDFWAPWCGPCRMLAPTLEQLAEEYAWKVKVCKINVDESPTSAIKFQVQGIPNVIIFHNWQVSASLVWVKSAPEYKAVLDSLISDGNEAQDSGNNEETVTTNGDSNIINVNWSAEFEKATSNEKINIIDFRAPWCGPCRMLWPVLEEIAGNFESKVNIIKINVDEPANQPLAMQNNVSWIPNVLILKDGKQVGDAIVGAYPYDHFADLIENM